MGYMTIAIAVYIELTYFLSSFFMILIPNYTKAIKEIVTT